ncbi:MAG: recombinase family protein [Bacillota bacterium]|nr:recombinase family protein [Bacillota bacterium]
MKQVWNTAIYARVSTEKKEQQESIPAQVQSLKKWLSDKNMDDDTAYYNLIEVYEDAGFSGSSFERESFQRMMEAVEAGKINLVLTRDLSRFARNYAAAGYYLEDYFKIKGVRFISILDNVDTINDFDDIIPFKNILNEMYIKDCSRRVKDALRSRMLRGSSIASKPPYGYTFAEEYEGKVKTVRLVPAEDETEETVKEIFNLYLEGWGIGRISSHLNSKGTAPPSARLNFPISRYGKWTSNSIKSILANPKYGGIMVQQRYRKLSYKIKKIEKTSEKQWIIGGEFLGLVSKETFMEVQELLKKRAGTFRQKEGNIHLFSGVLECKECKGRMSYRKKYGGYKCSNSQKGGRLCTSHSVKEEFLRALIVSDLLEYTDSMVDKDQVYSAVKPKAANPELDLKRLEGCLRKLDAQFERLYTEVMNETISQRNFETAAALLQKKQHRLLREKEELQDKIKTQYNKKNPYELLVEEINKVLSLSSLDRMTVERLIERIVVSENKENKSKDIEIYYRFACD